MPILNRKKAAHIELRLPPSSAPAFLERNLSFDLEDLMSDQTFDRKQCAVPAVPVSAFDFDVLKSALRQLAAEEHDPATLRYRAYQLAMDLCPGHVFSDEMIDALTAAAQGGNRPANHSCSRLEAIRGLLFC